MAPTVTPPATVATSPSPATKGDESRFFKLSPELRNRIYQYAFTTVRTTGLVPHAFTQVNRQIRSESQAMYYASVESVVLPLRTLPEIRCAQRWLAEVDMSLYPVLPDIELLIIKPHTETELSVLCSRHELVPTQQLSHALALCTEDSTSHEWSDKAISRVAFGAAYNFCLGFETDIIDFSGLGGKRFRQALEKGSKWISRMIEYEHEGPRAPDAAMDGIFNVFFEIAYRKGGQDDWDTDDLQGIVGWLEKERRYL